MHAFTDIYIMQILNKDLNLHTQQKNYSSLSSASIHRYDIFCNRFCDVNIEEYIMRLHVD